MKLVRFGERGAEKPGLVDDAGRIRDVSAHVVDYDHAFFSGGGLDRLRTVAATLASLPEAPVGVRLGPPIARPRKLLAIGLNYSDHAKETNKPIPTEPVLFMKATTAVCGPNDPILIPRGSTKTDWEVELAVVLARDARYLASPDESRNVVAGFAIGNDVSERSFQIERGGQWSKGKSSDNFFPLGPWLVTLDEGVDPHALSLTLDVNGVRKQTGHSSNMIFSVWHLVWYLSQFLTLEAGDVITTGTPPGVGMARTPPEFLRAGDVVELAIDGLGRQRCECVQA